MTAALAAAGGPGRLAADKVVWMRCTGRPWAGPYALPYYGTGFKPGADRYTVPYTADGIAEIDIFVLPQQEQQAEQQPEEETGQQLAGTQSQTQQK